MSEYGPAALAARISPMFAEALQPVRPEIHSGLSVRVPVITPAGVADVLSLLTRQPLILAGVQSILDRFASVPPMSKPRWITDGLARHLIGAPGFIRGSGTWVSRSIVSKIVARCHASHAEAGGLIVLLALEPGLLSRSLSRPAVQGSIPTTG